MCYTLLYPGALEHVWKNRPEWKDVTTFVELQQLLWDFDLEPIMEQCTNITPTTYAEI